MHVTSEPQSVFAKFAKFLRALFLVLHIIYLVSILSGRHGDANTYYTLRDAVSCWKSMVNQLRDFFQRRELNYQNRRLGKVPSSVRVDSVTATDVEFTRCCFVRLQSALSRNIAGSDHSRAYVLQQSRKFICTGTPHPRSRFDQFTSSCHDSFCCSLSIVAGISRR